MAEERRRDIVELLASEGRVRVEELAKRFDVSVVTIRKDLVELEDRGLLQRTHGGAVYVHKSRFSLSFLEKLQLQSHEKQAIAAAAMQYIKEGDTLILDAGSTTLALAQLIKHQFRRLFIITCSIPVALELSDTSWELLLVGGQVRHHSLALIGPAGVTTLENYHADKAFVGTTGLTLPHGYSTPNPLDAQMKQAILHSADETYVVTDSTKIGHPALAKFAQLDEVKVLVTDTAAPRDFLNALDERGIAYALADPLANTLPTEKEAPD
jgi:DeoR family transcriptional regulator of aga operon/DeoR family fructose operon transcriptional repressor